MATGSTPLGVKPSESLSTDSGFTQVGVAARRVLQDMVYGKFTLRSTHGWTGTGNDDRRPKLHTQYDTPSLLSHRMWLRFRLSERCQAAPDSRGTAPDSRGTLSPMDSQVVAVGVIVPCFNEEHRLAPERLLMFVKAGVTVFLVDDGSTDGTAAVIETACKEYSGFASLRLSENCGKGEAVRLGMLHAISTGVEVVGFLDADLATPPEEMLRLLDHILDSQRTRVVIGSRIRLLGYHVERSTARHYLSRFFATFASIVLRTTIYDTQCGAKWFLVDERLKTVLSLPCRTRWIFDIEILQRLLSYSKHEEDLSTHGVKEVPLKEWKEASGSKLTAGAMGRAWVDLLRLEVATWRSHRQR